MCGTGAPLARRPELLRGCLQLPAAACTWERAGHWATGTCTDQGAPMDPGGTRTAGSSGSGVPGVQQRAGETEPPAQQLLPGLSSSQLMGLPVTWQSSLAPAPPRHPLSLPARTRAFAGPVSHPAPPAPYPGTWPAPRAAPSPACASPGLSGHLQWGDTVRAAPSPPSPSAVPAPARHGGIEQHPQGASITGPPLAPLGTHLAWAWGWQQEPARLQPGWGGRSGGARPSRARLWCLGGSWHRRGPLHQQPGPWVRSRGAASLLGKGQQQRGRGPAGQWRGAMPLLWGAPSQGAGGAQGGPGHTRGGCSLPRGPQLQGWGRGAVLMASRLEGRVGHAAECCSQREIGRASCRERV